MAGCTLHHTFSSKRCHNSHGGFKSGFPRYLRAWWMINSSETSNFTPFPQWAKIKRATQPSESVCQWFSRTMLSDLPGFELHIIFPCFHPSAHVTRIQLLRIGFFAWARRRLRNLSWVCRCSYSPQSVPWDNVAKSRPNRTNSCCFFGLCIPLYRINNYYRWFAFFLKKKCSF